MNVNESVIEKKEHEEEEKAEKAGGERGTEIE